ncbi:isoprenylcysteine carboxylmethyltransferase family protein [Hwanghaeella grinnelliae]|uniref:Isoprenylcysteine carboxylmethyltransferase family protein n=1 Tax=Hwanghaeella grinnelliae TaxID=2500179 RepID=A0A437QTG9_9PROT|nr:isoprenylcysteine carboxylmethyltransferase family protein [Hwanghaeella grinnelliae]RVU37790.1 isoprenylcysteine carboxylmethyltransferase family protein [Hwanghaeella grinnelliae]
MNGDQEDFDRPDHAGVRVPPPLIFLVFLGGGIWLDSAWIAGAFAPLPWMIAGGCLLAAGLALIVLAGVGHFAAGTHVEPWKPTSAIVSSGLYAHSRNPMYLGMALGQVGVAAAAGSLIGALSVVFSVAVVQWYVIGREERYLEAKFGQPYLDYKRRVRRWI